MEPGDPGVVHKLPNTLALPHEDEKREVVSDKYTGEDASDDSHVAEAKDPVEEVDTREEVSMHSRIR